MVLDNLCTYPKKRIDALIRERLGAFEDIFRQLLCTISDLHKSEDLSKLEFLSSHCFTPTIMCDEQVLSLQNVLQSVTTKMPIIVLQRVEETFPAVRESTNCMDLLKHKPGLCSETCPTSSGDCNQVTNIKVEEEAEPIIFPVIKTEHEVSNIKQEEDPEPIIFPVIKTEHEVTLNEQVQIHSGKHSFLCDICNKAFRQKSHLVEHQRIHSGERPYSCDVCNKAFSQKSHLIRHQRIHSGERPYSCDVCNKAFRQKINLIKHQRIHSGEQPYSCEVCNKAFSDKSNLIKHQRMHSGERPYSCDICNKAFILKIDLIIHQRIHTG